jgi:hypothetical protein
VAPPASANQREFTMSRLLDLSDVVLQKLLSPDGLDTRYEDIPFRCALVSCFCWSIVVRCLQVS